MIISHPTLKIIGLLLFAQATHAQNTFRHFSPVACLEFRSARHIAPVRPVTSATARLPSEKINRGFDTKGFPQPQLPRVRRSVSSTGSPRDDKLDASPRYAREPRISGMGQPRDVASGQRRLKTQQCAGERGEENRENGGRCTPWKGPTRARDGRRRR